IASSRNRACQAGSSHDSPFFSHLPLDRPVCPPSGRSEDILVLRGSNRERLQGPFVGRRGSSMRWSALSPSSLPQIEHPQVALVGAEREVEPCSVGGKPVSQRLAGRVVEPPHDPALP